MDNYDFKLNTKDIAATIIEEGFIIGKKNAVRISIDCDALEIYKLRKPLKIAGMKINRKPVYIGKLYFKENGKFSKSWYLDNEKIGEPIEKLAKKLEDTYNIRMRMNDEYDVVWGKEDMGI